MYSLIACVWLEQFSFCGNSQRIVQLVRHCNGDLCEFTSCLRLGSFLAPLSENIRILLCRLMRRPGTTLLLFSVFDETFFLVIVWKFVLLPKAGIFLVHSIAMFLLLCRNYIQRFISQDHRTMLFSSTTVVWSCDVRTSLTRLACLLAVLKVSWLLLLLQPSIFDFRVKA